LAVIRQLPPKLTLRGRVIGKPKPLPKNPVEIPHPTPPVASKATALPAVITGMSTRTREPPLTRMIF
jgi:hypothetical protein